MSSKNGKTTTTQARQQQAPQGPESAGALTAPGLDYGADAGKGLEGADKESFAIPFLAILQPMSPQVLEGVAGATPGKFINTVTGDLYTEPLLVPCTFQRRFIRWAPRESGGGFKGEFTPAQVNELRTRGAIKDLDARLYFPMEDGSVHPNKSDRLADTRSHFVLIVGSVDAELGVQAVFALTSTGIKVSKNWLSRIDSLKVPAAEGRIVNAPAWAMAYKVVSVKKSNDKGTWWTPEIAPAALITRPALYAQAKAFNASVAAGKVEVAHDTVRDVGTGEGDGTAF